MLIKMLPKKHIEHMLNLASLMTISDKPILWDDKTYNEITAETNLKLISLKVGDEERELISDLERSNLTRNQLIIAEAPFSLDRITHISNQLTEVLQKYPFAKMENPGTRVGAATTVLQALLEQTKYDSPSTPKIILYELFLVALHNGHISGVEWALLKEFQRYHKLEDFIFDDLLERAETLSQEISKTISIILE
ncbi:hypothetical protein [Vreelandella titanicae]|uniref:hypothetical protein n=1 Tax=Vreelandella titanicae TaxID=664683 RepID=UPI0039BEDBD0